MQQGCHQYTSSARGWNEGRDRSRARARRISIRGSGGAPAESAGDTAPRLDLGVLRRQLRMALPFKQFTEVPLRLGQLDSQVPTSSEIFQETRGRWASSPRRLRHDGVGARGRCEKSVTFLPSSTMFYDCHSLSFCLGTPRPPELSLSKARRLLHFALLASRWVDTALSGIASRMFTKMTLRSVCRGARRSRSSLLRLQLRNWQPFQYPSSSRVFP